LHNTIQFRSHLAFKNRDHQLPESVSDRIAILRRVHTTILGQVKVPLVNITVAVSYRRVEELIRDLCRLDKIERVGSDLQVERLDSFQNKLAEVLRLNVAGLVASAAVLVDLAKAKKHAHPLHDLLNAGAFDGAAVKLLNKDLVD